MLLHPTIWCQCCRVFFWFHAGPVVSTLHSNNNMYWRWTGKVLLYELIVFCMLFSESFNHLITLKLIHSTECDKRHIWVFAAGIEIEYIVRVCVHVRMFVCVGSEQQWILCPCRANICHLVVNLCKDTHMFPCQIPHLNRKRKSVLSVKQIKTKVPQGLSAWHTRNLPGSVCVSVSSLSGERG